MKLKSLQTKSGNKQQKPTRKEHKKELIQSQFDKFIDNTHYLDKIQNMDLHFMDDGALIELFCVDFAEGEKLMSKIRGQRVTPYARVLQIHAHPDLSSNHKNLEPGDIVLLGDDTSFKVENEKAVADDKYSNNPTYEKALKETPRYIRPTLDRWFESGLFFYPDKLDMMTNDLFLENPGEFFTDFTGPYIFLVPLGYIKFKVDQALGVQV